MCERASCAASAQQPLPAMADIADLEAWDEPESIVVCDGCDTGYPSPEITQRSGLDLCGQCIDDIDSCNHHRFEECKACANLCDPSDTTEVSGEMWCRACRDASATRCDHCDDWTSGDTINVGYQREICESCYESDFFTCDECGNVCHNDDYDGDGLCEECARDRRRECDDILDYSYDITNRLRPIGKPKDGVFYGVELEVESADYDNRSSDVTECINWLGDDFAIAKHDGSLDDETGFELVSIHSEFDTVVKRWSNLLDHKPHGLGSWESGRCGMHVHVSRDKIGEFNAGKILAFIHAPANDDFITKIAGRRANRYCEREESSVSDVKRRYKCSSRYRAVNLSNDHTIEFRLFRGTLKKESFLRNLEFVRATIGFCRHTGLRDLTVSAFCRFVERSPKVYPNLSAWLRSKQLIRTPNPRPARIPA